MNNGYLVFIKRTRYYINIAIKNLKFPGVRLLLLFVVLTLLECAVGEFTSLYKAFIFNERERVRKEYGKQKNPS